MDLSLYFGASTGRSGTMLLANLLNSEEGVVCVHEGKFRHGEESGEQVLPFLTLENRQGYEYPDRKADIIAKKRLPETVHKLMETHGAFGDIAYNNSIFITELAAQFPEAKFLISVRDGREFVRSATVLEGEDLTPVGWAPDEKPMTPLEQYIAMGRLRPRRNSELNDVWDSWDAFEKNCWLWNETNRVIFESLDQLDNDRFKIIDLRSFKTDGEKTYSDIRAFLGFKTPMTDKTRAVLTERPINAKTSKNLPHHSEWSKTMQNTFWEHCSEMMERLNYD